MSDHSHEDILAQAQALGRDGYGTASTMLYDLAARCYPAKPTPSWQQVQQQNLERLGLMPSTGQEGNAPGLEPIHNHGDATDDMGQPDAPTSDAPSDPPSSEEPTA